MSMTITKAEKEIIDLKLKKIRFVCRKAEG